MTGRRLAGVVGLALCAALALASCAAPATGGPIDPVGWWVRTGDKAVNRDPNYVRLIGGRLETVTPCSVYSAALRGTPGEDREVASGSGGPVACAAKDMSADAAYLVTLQEVTDVRLDESTLVLSGTAGTLRFRRLEPADVTTNPKAGTWRLHAVSFAGQLRAALPKPQATIVWDTEGRVSGSTGCHRFDLPYSQRSAPDLDEAELAGQGATPLTLEEDIDKTPECSDELVDRQDSWVRSVLRGDVMVMADQHVMTVSRGETSLVYRWQSARR